jgi:hypothetical protein
MLRPGEDADEPPKHQLEPPLRVLRRKLRDRGLLSDDQRQLGATATRWFRGALPLRPDLFRSIRIHRSPRVAM